MSYQKGTNHVIGVEANKDGLNKQTSKFTIIGVKCKIREKCKFVSINLNVD